jgi:hypothetical protein
MKRNTNVRNFVLFIVLTWRHIWGVLSGARVVYSYEMKLEIKKEEKKLISKEASYIVRKLIFSKFPCWWAGPMKEPNIAASLENGRLIVKSWALATVRFLEKKQVLERYASQKRSKS